MTHQVAMAYHRGYWYIDVYPLFDDDEYPAKTLSVPLGGWTTGSRVNVYYHQVEGDPWEFIERRKEELLKVYEEVVASGEMVDPVVQS